MDEKFFSCDCNGEILRLTDDKENTVIDIAIYEYGAYHNSKSFWRRLKYALYHIWTGKIYSDYMCVDYNKAKEIGEWLILKTKQ